MPGMATDPDRPLASLPTGLVREFHEYVGSTVRATPSVSVEGAARRCDFVDEEARELRDAVECGDVVAAADALAISCTSFTVQRCASASI